MLKAVPMGQSDESVEDQNHAARWTEKPWLISFQGE